MFVVAMNICDFGKLFAVNHKHDKQNTNIFKPLTPTVAIWVQLQSILFQPDRVKPSSVIFDIRALWRSILSVRVPGCQKLQMTV